MVATLLSPALGRMADLWGQARVLLVALGVFLIGSLGAAILPGFPALILCRAAQGAGGVVVTLTFAIAWRHLDDRSAKVAIAASTGIFGAGAIVGFGTGGLTINPSNGHCNLTTGCPLPAFTDRPGGSNDLERVGTSAQYDSIGTKSLPGPRPAALTGGL